MPKKRRWFRVILFCLIGLFLLLSAAGLVLYFKGPDWMEQTVESEGFRKMLSKEVSKSLKVRGEFAPLKLDGWKAKTASYESTGEPGQAIGSLDAYGIEGTFDPSGIFKSQWLLSLIKVDKGKFVLREPNDALKQPEKEGKKPWYAFLMPTEFHVNWIECPTADVDFPLGGLTGGLKDVHLGATMIGQNFKYYVKNGSLEFPGFAPLQVDALGVYVTRNIVQVDYAYLRAPKGDQGKLQLTGSMGQRQDKSIDAQVKVDAFEIDPFLPEEVRPLLSGLVTGDFAYKVDKSGKNASGTGQLTWTGAGLGDWGPLNDVARIPGNKELTQLEAKEAIELNYTLDDQIFKLPELEFTAMGKVRFKSSVEYDLEKQTAKLNASLQDMPISVWLPKELQTITDAMIQGTVEWTGSVEQWQSSTASGKLDFSGATVDNPVTTIASLGKYAPRFPAEVDLTQGTLDFNYDQRVIKAKKLVLNARDFFEVEGSGSWGLDDQLNVDVHFRFPSVESWLPEVLKKQLKGTLRGNVDWSAPRVRLEEGQGGGTIALDDAVLADFEFQQFIARFLKDDSWLNLSFDTMEIDWKREDNAVVARRIDLFAPGKAGLTGSVRVSGSGDVSGDVQVGLPASALEWLPDATTTIFDQEKKGLFWADVELSGTTQKFEQNLVPRVKKQIEKHPVALAGLVGKGISWWLGDVLGTAPEVGDETKEKKAKPVRPRPTPHRPHMR